MGSSDSPTSRDPSAAAGPFRLVTLGGLALFDATGASAPIGPRNLALLAYLALASTPLSRDHVAELFWGDKPDDRARHSMREALSRIRQLLGPDAIPRRSEQVALADDLDLSVDARALDAAAAAGDTATVVRLYAGPFFDGIHPGSARSFEDWCDAQRGTYEARFTAACAVECARLRDEAQWTQLASLARRWLRAAPLDPNAAVALLHALAAPGTADAHRVALREYQHIAERLATDFEVAPHPLVTAAAVEIEHAPIRAVAVGAAPAHSMTIDEPSGPRAVAPSVQPRRMRVVALAATVATMVVAATLLLHGHKSAAAAPTDAVAIAPLDVVGTGRDAWLATGVPRLLGSALVSEHVNVLDAGRVRAVMTGPNAGDDVTTENATTAAAQLGARWMVRGSIVTGAHRYWLDLVLLDAHTPGAVQHITDADTSVDAIVTRATARIFARVHHDATTPELTDLEPNTVAEYSAYVRALRLHSQNRLREASAVLDTAIAADSAFLPAVIERRYLMGRGYVAASLDSASALESVYRANRAHATEFERLEFDAFLALHTGDHARAESLAHALVTHYPTDPRALARAYEIFTWHGKFDDGAAVARTGLALDSSDRAASHATRACIMCVGDRQLAEIYRVIGQLARSERFARRATAAAPDDPAAWAQLGVTLSTRDQGDDAIAAARHASALAPHDPYYALDPIRRMLEARRYDAADSALGAVHDRGDAALDGIADDLRILLLRERGQFAAAGRLIAATLARNPSDSDTILLVEGENDGRLGNITHASRAILADVPHDPRARPNGTLSGLASDWARTYAWSRTVLVDTRWAGGDRDTLALARLADSIATIGARSYYGRDWRLFHHVRGLIAMSARRWPEAASEFQGSRWGRYGWTRSLVELAHAQRASGDTRSAIETLRDARAASLAAMGRYVPKSEIDFELARTFSDAGDADSARVYRAYVERAWRTADPAVRRRLAELPSR